MLIDRLICKTKEPNVSIGYIHFNPLGNSGKITPYCIED